MKRLKFLLVALVILLNLTLSQPSLAESSKFSQEPDGFKTGQQVIWLYQARPGHDDIQRIPAQIVKLGPKQVQIRVQKDNSKFLQRWVNRDKLEIPQR